MEIVGPLIFLFIVYAFISSIWTSAHGAPFVPTRVKKIYTMLKIADVKPGELVCDLGCGDGRVLVIAVHRFGARGLGIELDPVRYLISNAVVRALRVSSKVRIARGNFYSVNLKGVDVVFCYLLRRTNTQLQEKLVEELRPGSRVISNTFPFPGWQPVQEDPKAGWYLYRMPPDPA